MSYTILLCPTRYDKQIITKLFAETKTAYHADSMFTATFFSYILEVKPLHHAKGVSFYV